MSRHSFTTEDGNTVAYGLDPVPFPGYFLQVINPGEAAEDQPGIDVLVEQMDTRPSMSGKLAVRRTKIAERLQELGGPDEHVERILSDLPL